jgi:hypothetical protein
MRLKCGFRTKTSNAMREYSIAPVTHYDTTLRSRTSLTKISSIPHLGLGWFTEHYSRFSLSKQFSADIRPTPSLTRVSYQGRSLDFNYPGVHSA